MSIGSSAEVASGDGAAAVDHKCPDLGTLERAPLAADVRAHVAGCRACALVVEVFDAGALQIEDCVRFDALLAARHDGTLNRAGINLLERHLAGCEECRAVAETLSPVADADGDHAALPRVDPGAYALGLEVARGGMGRILAARDLRVGRPVAVKELLGRSPDLAARFEREARVTARLQHPGIVPIYEIGRWPDGTPFYSMRMVDGRTLQAAIDSTTPASRLALLPAIISAAEAVAFAHSQRVIHRDLTPSNILVGGFGETVVIDWGLAKDLADERQDDVASPYRDGDSAGKSLTGVGAVIGTAAYMPPEQAHAQPVDERADVYALGAILYHLLAGHPPYRAKTTAELLRQVKAGPPPPIDAVAPHTPRDLVSIVGKAMARDPDARYPSARELVEELDRFRTGRMVEAHAYSRFEIVRRFVGRNRGVVTAIALAAIVLAVIATISVTRIVTSRAEARATVRNLLEEEGRVELLAGNPLRALAYLHAAYDHGVDHASLRFLLASAVRDIANVERDLDCGDDVRFFELSPDDAHLAAACQDVGRIFRMDDGQLVATLGPFVGGFMGARYSHDGKTLATWGADGNARLWDAATGALRATLPHGAQINLVRFTPDDRRVSTAGNNGLARVWNVDGSLHRTFVASTSLLRHVYAVISGDGRYVFTITIDGDAKGWDIETGELRGGFTHGGLALGGDLSPDGTRAVTCGTDRQTKLWDATTGNALRTMAGHTDAVWRCIFSSDGKRVLTGAHDGTATVWDVESGALVATVPHGGVVWMVSFAPDGRRFSTMGLDGRVKVWDAASGGLLASHDTLGGKVAKFTRDGRRLVAGRGDGRLRVWRDPSGPLVGSLPASTTVAISDDGSRAAIEDAAGWITLVDTHGNRPLSHERIHAPIALRGGSAIASTPGAIVSLDLATGKTQLRIPQPERPLAIVVAASSARFAVRQRDGLHVFDGARSLGTIAGARDGKLSADGRRIATTAHTAAPITWQLDDRGPAQLTTLAPARRSRLLGMSRDGTRVALIEELGVGRHVVTLWNAETGAQIAELSDSSLEPSFDPGGTMLTTIGADHVVTVWDVRDGSAKRSFVGDAFLQAQVDPTGSLVAAIGSLGKDVVVVSAADGRVLARWGLAHNPAILQEHEFRAPPAFARWSHDGGTIVTQAASIDIWSASSRVNRAHIERLVRAHVPWHVVGGRLAWIQGRVTGRVVRDGVGVAGVRVVAEIRKPPDLGAAPVSWVSSRTRVRQLTATTDDDGHFELVDLFPGHYSLTAIAGDRRARPVNLHVGIATDPVEIDLGR